MTCCDDLITKEYVTCLLKCLVSNIELFRVCGGGGGGMCVSVSVSVCLPLSNFVDVPT